MERVMMTLIILSMALASVLLIVGVVAPLAWLLSHYLDIVLVVIACLIVSAIVRGGDI
jgi:hypothetical protein